MNAKEYEFLVGKHDVPEHRLNSSVEYRRTKREINRFCKGLSLDTKQYLPERACKNISMLQTNWIDCFIRRLVISFFKWMK